MEKDPASSQQAPAPTATSFFEKAHEPRWVGRFAIAVLFADIVLVWRTGTGIRYWAFDGAVILRHAGLLIVDMLMLGVLSAFILPVANAMTQRLVFELYIYLSNWLQTDPATNPPSFNHVHSSYFYQHVLRTRDPVLWDIWKDHIAQRSLREPTPLATSKLPFSLLVLALVNFLLPSIGTQGSTLIRDGVAMLGTHGLWIFFSVLGMSLWSLCSVWCASSGSDYVYCPLLYEEIQARKHEPTPSFKRGLK